MLAVSGAKMKRYGIFSWVRSTFVELSVMSCVLLCSTHNLLRAVYLLKLLGDLQCSVRTTVINHYDLVVVATALKHGHVNKHALFKTNEIVFLLIMWCQWQLITTVWQVFVFRFLLITTTQLPLAEVLHQQPHNQWEVFSLVVGW